MVVEKKVIFLTTHDEIWEAEGWQSSFSGPHSETQVKERKERRKGGEGKGREGRESILFQNHGVEEVMADRDEQVTRPYVTHIVETVPSLEDLCSFL